MSRIGKKLITLPAGVTVALSEEKVTVKGPKGELALALHPQVLVEEKTKENGDRVLAVTAKDASEDSAIWGTMRAILANNVNGVATGWSKILELNGVGYKMNVKGRAIVMSLGFSHEVTYNLPEGIDAVIETNKLTISGVSRELVGKVASEIRGLKKPEPYKGKGFKYSDEIIRRKAGKSAKSDK